MCESSRGISELICSSSTISVEGRRAPNRGPGSKLWSAVDPCSSCRSGLGVALSLKSSKNQNVKLLSAFWLSALEYGRSTKICLWWRLLRLKAGSSPLAKRSVPGLSWTGLFRQRMLTKTSVYQNQWSMQSWRWRWWHLLLSDETSVNTIGHRELEDPSSRRHSQG